MRAVVGSATAPNAVLSGKFKSYLKSVTNINISDKCHMVNDQLPAMLKAERKQITEELAGKEIGVVQDGTPFGGNLVATFARYVREQTETAAVIQRLIDLYFAKSSVSSFKLQGVCHRAGRWVWSDVQSIM